MNRREGYIAGSMFRPRPDAPTATIEVEVEGRTVRVPEGASAAAAVLLAGLASLRDTPVTGSARTPYCMMGVCFDCLAEIDGVPNRQSCIVTARPGMRIRRQRGAREIDPHDVPEDLPSFPIPAPRSGGA